MTCDFRFFRRLPGLLLLTLLLPSGLAAQAPPGASQKPARANDSGSASGVTESPEALPARPMTGVCFTEIQLRDLPSSRSLWSLIETADEMTIVDRIENGGLYLGEMKLMGNVGSSWTQTGFTSDGLDLTNPARTGTPLMYPDPEVLGSVLVISSLPTVDMSGAGPTVAITPRAPARRWGGSLQASYLPNLFQVEGDGAAPPIARFGSAGDGSLLLSGPLGPPGSGILLSGRRSLARRFERNHPTPLDSRLSSFFLHSIIKPASGDQIRVVASTDAASQPFAGRQRFPDTSASARNQFWHLHGIWERASSDGTTWSAAAAYDRGVFGVPDGMTSSTIGVIERLTDGPVADTVASSGGVQQRWQSVFRIRPDLHRVAGGRQTVDLGLSLGRTISQNDAMPRAVVGELVDGLPARIWDYSWGGDATLRHATELGAWLNDRIELHPRLTLEAGVRFEATRATGRDNPTAIDWQTILPRGTMHVNLTRSGSVSAHAGYAIYRHRLPLDYLAYGDASAPSALVYRWNDANGDRLVQPSEMGTLVAVAGPGRRPDTASGIDGNLQPPLTDEFAIGFDLRFGSRWRGRVTGIERHLKRLVAPVNAGVTLDDYTRREIADRGNDFFNPVDDRYLVVYDRNPSSFGLDRDVLTNPNGHHGNQVALDLALERLFDGRWYMRFGATAQRSDGYAGNPGFLVNENDTGVLGALFEDPNAETYGRGRLFFERGYIIKWSGGFVTSNDIHFGAIARYQDGQHFARLVIVPDLNQGPEAIQAYTRGHSRFTFTFTLDARVEKGFKIGMGRVALVAEAFNLLNNAIEVEEDPVVTHSFRATTAVQPPRAIRLGLRFEF